MKNLGEGGFKRLYEEYAYVLDFLPYGRSFSEKRGRLVIPTAQLLGEEYFTLLEVGLKPGATVAVRERIYVGKERRDKVNRVIGRVSFDELTATAKAEIESVLEELVKNRESYFVDFFNNAQAITSRMHALELLQGIGKKSMWQIVDEKEKQKFSDFKNIQERTVIADPVKIIARRIIEELTGESKYRLFTRTA